MLRLGRDASPYLRPARRRALPTAHSLSPHRRKIFRLYHPSHTHTLTYPRTQALPAPHFSLLTSYFFLLTFHFLLRAQPASLNHKQQPLQRSFAGSDVIICLTLASALVPDRGSVISILRRDCVTRR